MHTQREREREKERERERVVWKDTYMYTQTLFRMYSDTHRKKGR